METRADIVHRAAQSIVQKTTVSTVLCCISMCITTTRIIPSIESLSPASFPTQPASDSCLQGKLIAFMVCFDHGNSQESTVIPTGGRGPIQTM